MCEALGLGIFMLSACLMSVVLEYPHSRAHQLLPNADVRRALFGVAMGLTAAGIIYSPSGQRSGAHINPAVTLSFLRLGKIKPWDATFYVLAQLAGGLLGVLLAWALFPRALADPLVRFAVTVPGWAGVHGALITEAVISFVMMSVVLAVGSIQRLARFVGAASAVLIALDVYFAAPLSGFSMNPSRTAASALVANVWTAWWVYLVAPPLAMLAGAELHLRLRGARAMPCAKLHHSAQVRCIFCGFEPSA
ncbi:MAG: aquaporin [Polyangiaceae bacterium]